MCHIYTHRVIFRLVFDLPLLKIPGCDPEIFPFSWVDGQALLSVIKQHKDNSRHSMSLKGTKRPHSGQMGKNIQN